MSQVNNAKCEMQKVKDAINVQGQKKKLSDFETDIANWSRVLETNEQMPITRTKSSGPSGVVEIWEPAERRKTTLRVTNILTYSLYHPDIVKSYLCTHFPEVSEWTGLVDVKEEQIYEDEQKEFFSVADNTNDCNSVICRDPFVEKVAETLNIIEVSDRSKDPDPNKEGWGPCGYNSPKRNLLQPYCSLIDRINIPVESGSLTNGTQFTFRPSGGPVAIKDGTNDALSSDWGNGN